MLRSMSYGILPCLGEICSDLLDLEDVQSVQDIACCSWGSRCTPSRMALKCVAPTYPWAWTASPSEPSADVRLSFFVSDSGEDPFVRLPGDLRARSRTSASSRSIRSCVRALSLRPGVIGFAEYEQASSQPLDVQLWHGCPRSHLSLGVLSGYILPQNRDLTHFLVLHGRQDTAVLVGGFDIFAAGPLTRNLCWKVCAVAICFECNLGSTQRASASQIE